MLTLVNGLEQGLHSCPGGELRAGQGWFLPGTLVLIQQIPLNLLYVTDHA